MAPEPDVDPEPQVHEQHDLPTGRLSVWLDQARRVQADGGDAEVPCGDCTACCTSSYFVHIEPDETDTLDHVPPALRFPAPGLPDGHVVLGYDERGHCPMLADGRCSIYEHRPRTCRRYDCRVFAATGLHPNDGGKELVAGQVARWRFDLLTDDDRRRRGALRAAAAYLREEQGCFPAGRAPISASQLANLAVKVHELFLDEHDGAPDVETVRAALRS